MLELTLVNFVQSVLKTIIANMAGRKNALKAGINPKRDKTDARAFICPNNCIAS